MSRKNVRRKKPTSSPVSLDGIDVRWLVKILDESFDDRGTGKDASDYRRVFHEELEDELLNNRSRVNLYHVCEQLQGFFEVEDAIRHAGFIQGFMVCKQLLLGDPQISDAVSGGVR